MKNKYFKSNWDLLGLWILSPIVYLIVNFIFIIVLKFNINSFYLDKYLFAFSILIFFVIGLVRNISIENLKKRKLRWLFLLLPLLLLIFILIIALGSGLQL